ncbi:hypothetical protein EON66_01490 [archaeon]|nr:MAG: hypothetical protein EON66_01490 [archaeon]
MSATYGSNVTIRDFHTNGAISPDRDEHVVVEISTKYGDRYLGFDWNSEPRRAATVASVRSRQSVVYTAPITSEIQDDVVIGIVRPVREKLDVLASTSLASPLAQLTYDPSGFPLAAEASLPTKSPLDRTSVHDDTGVRRLLAAVVRAEALYDVLRDAARGRPSSVTGGVTVNSLTNNILFMLLEDVSDVPAIASIPNIPVGLLSNSMTIDPVYAGRGEWVFGAWHPAACVAHAAYARAHALRCITLCIELVCVRVCVCVLRELQVAVCS